MQITISSSERPSGASVNDALQWFCRSLGVFGVRDKENSCFRVFIELLKETRKGNQISSDGLSARLGIARGTVVHHLNRLMESGLVVSKSNRYSLKSSKLKEIVSMVKDDVSTTFDHLEKVAAEIDKSF